MSTVKSASVLLLFLLAAAAKKGCNNGDSGIACCMEGFTKGDNEAEGEIFIQREQYDETCKKSCQKLYPNSVGATESLTEWYRDQVEEFEYMFWNLGWRKCWCEMEPKLQDPKKPAYFQTCLFMEEAQYSACTKYQNLTDTWRQIDNSTVAKQQHCDSDNLNDQQWYRFVGNWSKLPENATSVEGSGEAGKRNCGSTYLAYLTADAFNGKSCHPCISDGIVTRNICFESVSTKGGSYEACRGDKRSIKVAACNEEWEGGENYYVYNFGTYKNVDGCHAFCAVE